MVTAKMAMADEESSSDEEDEEGAGSAAASAAAALEGMLEGSSSETKKRIAAEVAEMAELEEEADDVQLRLERLERLLDRRPLLLSSVLLRQNPHNVCVVCVSRPKDWALPPHAVRGAILLTKTTLTHSRSTSG